MPFMNLIVAVIWSGVAGFGLYVVYQAILAPYALIGPSLGPVGIALTLIPVALAVYLAVEQLRSGPSWGKFLALWAIPVVVLFEVMMLGTVDCAPTDWLGVGPPGTWCYYLD
jgi:hypothetical protein